MANITREHSQWQAHEAARRAEAEREQRRLFPLEARVKQKLIGQVRARCVTQPPSPGFLEELCRRCVFQDAVYERVRSPFFCPALNLPLLPFSFSLYYIRMVQSMLLPQRFVGERMGGMTTSIRWCFSSSGPQVRSWCGSMRHLCTKNILSL